MKKFNITGTCIPKKHYMVDISERIKQIIKLIEDDQYFTINRARQYGKTTTFSALYRELKDKYLVLRLSFEGLGSQTFSSDVFFIKDFVSMISNRLEFLKFSDKLVKEWDNVDDLYKKKKEKKEPFQFLSKKITWLCTNSDKEIILMIDEVDKTSNNQVFLNFLGMLRTKYLDRNEGLDTTFKSVILAGVHDVKNLKEKIKSKNSDNNTENTKNAKINKEPEESTESKKEGKYNSPWNIAANFKVDMSFHPKDIATMLKEYEADYNTGMNIDQISQEIYNYTSGYPFLVSNICKEIDEEYDKEWTIDGIKKVIKEMIKGRNTLFDDIIKNLDANKDLYSLVREILENGYRPGFSLAKQAIQIGHMYGILRERNGYTVIDNAIFELYLHEYISGKLFLEKEYVELSTSDSQFIRGAKLDMEQILRKFQELLG